ncbi:MAG TPA: DUF962 domain-containing protein [Candidatus Obscuribacterales bacterium]
MKKTYRTFSDFFPFYMEQHKDRRNRRLHFVGSLAVLAILFWALLSQQWLLLMAMPVAGYGFAWIGHFFFEKNQPATFQYPIYSLMGDWVMFWHILTGRLQF